MMLKGKIFLSKGLFDYFRADSKWRNHEQKRGSVVITTTFMYDIVIGMNLVKFSVIQKYS
ncbi:hypothetical protein J5TS2_23630 [Brevibacillus halotolerans]|nr:hypothetical protein J5TS2_23630 [Brevibacillus halotolerans]